MGCGTARQVSSASKFRKEGYDTRVRGYIESLFAKLSYLSGYSLVYYSRVPPPAAYSFDHLFDDQKDSLSNVLMLKTYSRSETFDAASFRTGDYLYRSDATVI